jgi:hypothetical protein
MSAAEDMTLMRVRALQIVDCDVGVVPSEPQPEADRTWRKRAESPANAGFEATSAALALMGQRADGAIRDRAGVVS